MPILRLTHGADTFEPQPPAAPGEDSSSVLQQISVLSAVLATALSGIEQIQRRLARLEEITDPQGMTDEQWHDSHAARQAAIDGEIQAIDELAATTVDHEVTPLDGTWSVALADPSVGGVRTLRIASMASHYLGTERIGGVLSSLASGHIQPIDRSDPARGRAVIRCAMLQAAAVHEQISAFLRDALDPLRLSLEVVSANVEAAQSAFEDMDLAHHASRLTRLDALMNACPSPRHPGPGQSFSLQDPTTGVPGDAGV